MIVKFVVFILMIKFGFRLLNSEIGNDHDIYIIKYEIRKRVFVSLTRR